MSLNIFVLSQKRKRKHSNVSVNDGFERGKLDVHLFELCEEYSVCLSEVTWVDIVVEFEATDLIGRLFFFLYSILIILIRRIARKTE